MAHEGKRVKKSFIDNIWGRDGRDESAVEATSPPRFHGGSFSTYKNETLYKGQVWGLHLPILLPPRATFQIPDAQNDR